MSEELWSGVDRLLDRAPSTGDILAHGVQLLAADRLRRLDQPVPDILALRELVAIEKAATAPVILRAARDAFDGRLLVLKGPEIAARYPAAHLRPSRDLDLLADDAEAAQRALIAAGFRSTGPYEDAYYDGLHHLRPLELPGHPVPHIEIHRRPGWLDWEEPPPAAELFALAEPSATGIEGLLALPSWAHSVLVAAHSWAERPLRRLLDLIDVAAVLGSTRPEAGAVASAWSVPRLWTTTMGAIDALLYDGPTPWSLRLWARDLPAARGRTVFEDHLRRWLAPFWALPPHRATVQFALALAQDVTPAPNETWRSKYGRAGKAIRHARQSHSEHAQMLGPEGVKPRLKRR
jgi:hypothetical protein